MHQTTIRFANDAWARIEHEARARGVSAAQFVREATLARLAVGLPANGQWGAGDDDGAVAVEAWKARANAEGTNEGSEALWAQAEQARKRARETRATAKGLMRPAGRNRP